MSPDSLERLEQRLLEWLREAENIGTRPGADAAVHDIDAVSALAIWRAQLMSRAVDLAARRLRAEGVGYYTIGSAGHEQNAVLGQLLAHDDPCFLHYRSGAFVMARALRAGHDGILRDVLMSLRASELDPIARGRHKVWGSRPLWIVPQTSTIASHLPKAVGLAFGLSRMRRAGLSPPVNERAIVACSFGDASTNHASALSGLHAARYAHRLGHAVPILFVCEDNGLGISERAPDGFIRDTVSGQSGLAYLRAEGSLDAVYGVCSEAISLCRRTRAPVFLHLETVRLGGHAGSDAESSYLSPSEIAAMEARDPLLENARFLTQRGLANAAALLDCHAEIDETVSALCKEAACAPQLTDAEAVMAALPPLPDASRCARGPSTSPPAAPIEPLTPAAESARPLAAHITRTLGELLETNAEIFLFGEDVGRKGGVYGVTAGLQRRFGVARVFDTMLDETSILGTAQGLALAGALPIPEIQYLAYLHNAIDQLRGEASSMSFFSDGQFRNPMVVRIASFAYQKGFGGHFHNDNAIGALREIPGLALAAPARGDDAARMLRAAVDLARRDGRVVCFLEPIALYFESDLHGPGDRGWLTEAPLPGETLPPGIPGLYGAQAPDLLLISYANGLRLCLRAARQLERDAGLRVRVLDLRWLAPLPLAAVEAEATRSGCVMVVDECRSSGGGIADAVIAHLAETGYRGRLGSLRARDSFVPLGPAAHTVLVGEDEIVDGALRLVD
jgi:2-oxoisovalerate dehydrogenase E1 component